MNQIPMHTGVRVISHDPRQGETGTTVDRTEGGAVVVEFPDGAKRAYAEEELQVLV